MASTWHRWKSLSLRCEHKSNGVHDGSTATVKADHHGTFAGLSFTENPSGQRR